MELSVKSSNVPKILSSSSKFVYNILDTSISSSIFCYTGELYSSLTNSYNTYREVEIPHSNASTILGGTLCIIPRQMERPNLPTLMHINLDTGRKSQTIPFIVSSASINLIKYTLLSNQITNFSREEFVGMTLNIDIGYPGNATLTLFVEHT